MFYIICGWKMNLGVSGSVHYAEKIKEFICSINDLSRDLRIIVFPDFLSLYSVIEILKNSPVEAGSQDSFWEDRGAFTGEVSPLFLSEIGCRYILLGHPERSINLKEDKQMVNKKVKAALRNNLTPFLIVFEKKDPDKEKIFLQLREDVLSYLEGLEPDEISKIIMIYEPLWAINTANAAPPDHIKEKVISIRNFIDKEYGSGIGSNLCITYGGGVNENNFKDILDIKELDGIGIGHASLDLDFMKHIIKTANEKKKS
ncbi:MAG TPA: triose-phosphate isomerase family protein [Candidatus Humimicrobiaceae bacterium]|nr:triose-phosphate isomerase family protein [Candidatus Humimicrobiaceae bacterium]